MSGTWAAGWASGDVVTAAEFAKGVGCISDTTLSGSAASFDITSIVSAYQSLRIEFQLRGDNASATVNVGLRFNNDSAGNYDYEALTASTTTVAAAASTGQTSIVIGKCPAASATAGEFNAGWIEIPNFRGTTPRRSLTSMVMGTIADIAFTGSRWASATAITRVTLIPSSGNFAAGSRLTIYARGA